MDEKDQQFWMEADSASNSSTSTSTVDQNAILYDITTTFNNNNIQTNAGQNQVGEEDVNSILADIIFDYGIRKDGHKSEIVDDSAQFESCHMVAAHLNPLDPHGNLHQVIKTKTKKVTNAANGKAHKCSHCGKSFPSAYYLKFHENSVHLKSNTVECQKCKKTFPGGPYYLKQHIKRMHAQNRPHVCDICSMSFSVKYDLVAHSKTHIKTFSCEFCSKSYSTSRAMKEHARTHTGERPYQCSLCQKCFALPKTLRVHFRQHSGERPYLCSHCGMTFVQNSTLRSHLKTNHKQLQQGKNKNFHEMSTTT